MAMKQARNVDKCNIVECYSPQKSIDKHLRTFSTWRTRTANILQSTEFSRTVQKAILQLSHMITPMVRMPAVCDNCLCIKL